MRLSIQAFENKLIVDKSIVQVISIRNAHLFSKVVHSIYESCNAIDSELDIAFIDDHEVHYSLSKTSECLLNPLFIDFGSKKLQSMLTTRFKEILQCCPDQREYLENELKEIQRKVLCCLSELDVTCQVDETWDAQRMIKSLGIELEVEQIIGMTAVELLIEYLNIVSNLRLAEHYFFVGLNEYMDDGDIQRFYQEALKNNLSVICIERNHDEIQPSLFCQTLLVDEDFDEQIIHVKRTNLQY